MRPAAGAFEGFSEPSETLNGRRNPVLVSDAHIEQIQPNLPRMAMENSTTSGRTLCKGFSGIGGF